MSAMDPMLSATDLKEELRCVHATQHRTLNTAFYGTPTPNLDTIQVELERYGQVTFKVVHAPCELLARKALVDAKENALVMLIDFKDRLPLDLLSRLAGGKVRTITDERRLAHLFGAKSVSAEVLASPLRTALLASSINEFGTIPGTTLDLDTAWRKYLARVVALPEDAPMSEDRLIAHCAATPDQKGFRQVLASNPGLREGFLDFIGKKSGPIAQFAWRAWEAGRAREVAAFAFILQAAKGALHDKAYLDAWLSVRLGVIDQDLSEILNKDQKLIERWGGLADLLSLQFRNGAELDEILADAEKLLDEKIRNALGWSPYLPSSVQHGCQKLAAALTEALQTPTPERLLAMQQLLEQIEHHRLRDRERFRGQIERARMAARLVAFLSVAQAPLAPAPADRVCDLASFYSREGGFFDLARIRARGSVPLDELDKAIAAVVAKADKFRDDLDEQFAKALPAWMTHPKSERAVSIERVIDRFGVEFIAGGAHRRLLVLLLDGMAWADAVEFMGDRLI